MVSVAFALRLLVMTLGHTYRFPVGNDDHFSFGWETGRLARSIADGEGFSSPFHGQTGPSAWIAPLYPYFLAGIFKVFGVYTDLSAWVALAFNSLCSALTCVSLYRLGEEIFNAAVARWTAWIWAFLPYSIYWAVRFAWETSFAALLFSLVFLLAVRLERPEYNRLGNWLWFAVLWALRALANPALLAFLPFCGLWILHRQRRAGCMRLSWALASSVLFFALLTPWLARNYFTFGKFVFIRGNFGAEFRLGNGPHADGTWMFWLHPSQDPQEFERYRTLGEVTYVKVRQREAMDWIREHPLEFARISLVRVFYYWCGTPRAAPPAEYLARDLLYTLSSVLTFFGLWYALRNRERAAALFLWMLISVPMIYYFTFTHPRYRHPIEPEMLLLMVYLFTQIEPRRGREARPPAQPG